MPCVIYADIVSLIKKKQMDVQIIQKILQQQIQVSNIPCGYSMPAIFAFDNIENKHTLYHGQ